MAKILVTGSKGFIGTEILKKIDDSKIISDSIDTNRINLQNIEEVIKMDRADIVIHLGGKTMKGLDWNEYFKNNVLGTLNILEYCLRKNVKKLIFVSSYVYGKPKYSPIDELHEIDPHNAYTRSKYLAEQLCELYARNSKLEVIIVRPFNIFGKTLPKGFLISNLFKASQTNDEVTIVNKNSKRDFLHIDDFVDIILQLVEYETKFDIFNVGAGKSYSFVEIIQEIQKITDKNFKIKYNEKKEELIEDIQADISKIGHKLNWKPKISLKEGLARCKIDY